MKKKIILALAAIVIVFVVFKSCSSSNSLCGSDKHDLLRSACEKPSGADSKN